MDQPEQPGQAQPDRAAGRLTAIAAVLAAIAALITACNGCSPIH